MSKPSLPASFATIDSSDLDAVSGGITGAALRNDRLTTALTGLQSSVAQLGAGQQVQKPNPMAAIAPLLGGAGGLGATGTSAACPAPCCKLR